MDILSAILLFKELILVLKKNPPNPEWLLPVAWRTNGFKLQARPWVLHDYLRSGLKGQITSNFNTLVDIEENENLRLRVAMPE